MAAAAQSIKQKITAWVAATKPGATLPVAVPVVIFSKSGCPYCVGAKSLFKELKVPYNAVELDELSDGGKIQNELLAITNQRTVPNVYVAGQWIGGFDKTKAAHASGELGKLLASAGHDISHAKLSTTDSSCVIC